MKHCNLNIPPFKFDPKSGTIRNANDVIVLSLSVWGHLRYKLNLPLFQAVKKQNTFGIIVEEMLNTEVPELENVWVTRETED